MNILVILIISLVVFSFGIRIYGRIVARWLGEDPSRKTPAAEINDGKDYVPSNMNIVFGHHFSAIAGAGPIVGPTVAILFGFLPVWLWILVGSILIGAVHDFASLFISLREKGRSVADITRKTLGTTGFFLFICFAILLLVLVTSAFLSMTVQSLTSTAELAILGLDADQSVLNTVVKDGVVHGVIGGIASTSVIIITLFAPVLGFLIYKRKLNTAIGYLLAALVALGSIKIGMDYPITFSPKTWMLILSVYVTLAAAVPVWLILQPRDFTNVQILYVGIIGIFVAIVVGGIQGVHIQTPAVDIASGNARLGSIWPFLFITVACGAVSGFHSLVSTGTTSKQLALESQARKVGYNAMILEGVLATGAVLVVGAALSQQQYLNIVWPAPGEGVSNPILAFSLSMGLMLHQTTGIPAYYGSVFGILLVEGFVVTTLDAAVRLNRYLFEELWEVLFKGKTPWLMKTIVFNSGLSVLLMLWLAWNNSFTTLWPLFATTNQLLAALTLLAVSSWLLKAKRQAWFTILPAAFMVCTTIAALIMLFGNFFEKLQKGLQEGGNVSGFATLLVMDLLCLGLAVGVVLMAVKAFYRFRGENPVS
ncbi:carbon starvation protein A [Desulfococcaceae bacterium OttesenSCG-928-F15]|nr:carbon starvation protein A [Desulfococcaceae bacterium OttesenSCG-928-F15]